MAFVVALDPGYGNTKVATPAGVTVMQSAIARPRNVGMAADGVKVAQRPKSVIMADGREYVAGPGAWVWGDPETSMDYSDLVSQRRIGLFYAAFAEHNKPGLYNVDLLVIGLPVPLMQNELQAKPFYESLKVYKGGHAFRVDGEAYEINIKRVKVLAQPVGAYAEWSLDDQGLLRRGASQAEVGVIDLGMNTLDLFVVKGWEISPRYLGGEKLGVRRLLEALNGHHDRDIEELDALLRSQSLTANDSNLDDWLSSILGSLERNGWGSLRRFDAIIPTGGGVSVLGGKLHNALTSKGAVVYWPKKPVTPVAANVAGLYKWGLRVCR